MKYCPKCGNEVSESDQFCSNCSNDLSTSNIQISDDFEQQTHSQPKQKTSVFNSYLSTLKKPFVFKGRASRREYWTFAIVNFFIGTTLSTLEGMFSQSTTLSNIYSIAIFFPSLSVLVRRMHDLGKSGWFAFIPVVGLIFTFKKGEMTENKYGHPKLD